MVQSAHLLIFPHNDIADISSKISIKLYDLSYALLFAVHVAVLYCLFLMFICVFPVVFTTVVHYLRLRGDSKHLATIPVWVSWANF